jgi:hypothetical protein
MEVLIMADLNLRAEARSNTDWSAIWAGVFTFIGIWSVFELLGLAIFPATNANGKTGLGIWSIILTGIAMLVAGRQARVLARLGDAFDGARHGMIMFGLALTAAIVLAMSGSALFAVFPALATSAHGSYLLSAFTSSGWVPFAALFLGWLGAMIGASSGTHPKSEERSTVREMRPAA